RNAAAKTNDPQTFLGSLICLDSMPAKKRTRHLRDFFVCLFSKYFKHKPGLVSEIVRFCFREKMNPSALRQARSDFNKSFPNWPGIVKRILVALKAPRVDLSKRSLPS